MIDKTSEKIAEYYADNDRLGRAMGKAVQDALRTHKLLGYPIVVWRDGKVVWVPPEEIQLDDGNGAAHDTNGPAT